MDPVAEVDGLARVVRRQDHGQLVLAPDLAEQGLHAQLARRVEPRERLVEHEDPRRPGAADAGERPGDLEPPELPAREERDRRERVPPLADAHALQEIVGRPVALGLVDLGEPEREDHVLVRRQPRHHRRVLEHHCDREERPVRRRPLLLAPDQDRPLRRVLEPGHVAEQRRLAAPRRPHEHVELGPGGVVGDDERRDVDDARRARVVLDDIRERDGVRGAPRRPALGRGSDGGGGGRSRGRVGPSVGRDVLVGEQRLVGDPEQAVLEQPDRRDHDEHGVDAGRVRPREDEREPPEARARRRARRRGSRRARCRSTQSPSARGGRRTRG